MSRLPPLPSVGELVRLYRLRARRKLSQNFLMDMNLTKKIVRACGQLDECHVCEVGPGPGGITRALLNKDIKELSVVEVDRRFIPGLQMLADVSEKRMHIYQGDILNFDLSHHFPEDLVKDWHDSIPKIHLIGNLPFNIATPLVVKWLEGISSRTGAWRYGRTPLTLTFQKEIAERMVAKARSPQRCRLSIMCQHLCSVDFKFTIPGSAFVPPPKVDVGIVRLTPLKEPLIQLPFKLVEKVMRSVFHFRQKRIFRGIEVLFPPDQPELTDEMIEHADLSPDLRPYELTMDELNSLCHVYNDICTRFSNIRDYEYRTRENAKIWRQRRQVHITALEQQILEGPVT